jgi:ferric-dicitrate binding protein FerR (iron transport regulator)
VSACSGKVAALLAYETDALSAAGRARVDAHLPRCATCRETLASMRVYDRIAADVRQMEAPEPEWSRISLVLRREARAASQRASSGRGVLWAGVALAAAALLAFVLLHDDDRTIVTAPVLVPSEPEETVAVRETITGEITAVIDGVRGGTDGELAPIGLGDAVREGMTLVTAAPAEAHVRFDEGTGAVLEDETEARVETLRRGRVILALERGTVASEVASLGNEDAYEIHAAPYVVRVRGTRFAVRRAGGGVAVTVDEGVVEVVRDGEVVTVVEAPGRWSSTDAVEAPAQGEVASPIATGAEASRWPALRVAHVQWVTQWDVGGRPLPPGAIAMRVPEGRLHVEGRGDRDKVWRAELVMGPDGQMIEADAIQPAAPPVRTGTLAPELIAPVVRAGIPRLRRCQTEVDRDHGVWVVGSFTLRVTIGRTGEVQRAALVPVRVTGDVPGAFEQCVLGQVQNWTFPPPTGGIVTFEQPLSYRTAPTNQQQ